MRPWVSVWNLVKGSDKVKGSDVGQEIRIKHPERPQEKQSALLPAVGNKNHRGRNSPDFTFKSLRFEHSQDLKIRGFHREKEKGGGPITLHTILRPIRIIPSHVDFC